MDYIYLSTNTCTLEYRTRIGAELLGTYYTYLPTLPTDTSGTYIPNLGKVLHVSFFITLGTVVGKLLGT